MAGSSASPTNPKEQSKSYAAAVQEDAPSNQENGNGSAMKNQHLSDGNGKINGNGHKAAVLRIVNTNGTNGSTQNEAEEEDDEEPRPQLERQESRHEYSAQVYHHFLFYKSQSTNNLPGS